MEFNPLPDLLNTRFTIIEIGLFYGGEHLGAKICRFLTFFDKITSRWRRERRRGKHFKDLKYWLSSSNVLLKH